MSNAPSWYRISVLSLAGICAISLALSLSPLARARLVGPRVDAKAEAGSAPHADSDRPVSSHDDSPQDKASPTREDKQEQDVERRQSLNHESEASTVVEEDDTGDKELGHSEGDKRPPPGPIHPLPAPEIQLKHRERPEIVISPPEETLALLPDGHPHSGSSLSKFADALQMQYDQSGELGTLAEVIHLRSSALASLPDDDPERTHEMNSLYDAYLLSFDRDGDKSALGHCLDLQTELLDTWPQGHPRRHEAHHRIARVQLRDSPLFEWEGALNHLMHAMTDKSANTRDRLIQAFESLRAVDEASARDAARHFFSRSALDLYAETIKLLPLAAQAGFNISTRLREFAGSEQLCRNATMRAMLMGQLPKAVEFYEAGSASLWSQALQMRSTALDEVPAAEKDALIDLLELMDKGDDGSEDVGDVAAVEQQIENRRQLGAEVEDLIGKIRARPGFDRFLQTAPFEKLSQAAADGYVIALVGNAPFFSAIAMRAGQDPIPVFLPDVTQPTLDNLINQLSNSGMRDQAGDDGDTDKGTVGNARPVGTHLPLAEIWCNIVEPIILRLGLEKATGRQRPRVHWYPSGDFAKLPLHAAGIYEGSGQVTVSDYVVSSYTTSFTTLIKSRDKFVPVPREKLQILLFGEASGEGAPLMPDVHDEVETLAGIIVSKEASVWNDIYAVPTAEKVLEQLPAAHVLHLSCHGTQHSNPIESGFALRNGSLTVSDLMALNPPAAILAYLGACEAPNGDQDRPYQGVHLAAAILHCGFRSVVATMWSMYDADSTKVAQSFYEALLERETISLDDIPYALDAAVQELRSSGAPTARWATYVHLGA